MDSWRSIGISRLGYHVINPDSVVKSILLLGAFLLVCSRSFAQVEKSAELFRVLATKDSLLFNVGFNTCNISQFEQLISDNFEFYHDLSGITGSKSEFIEGIRNGLCKLPYKPKRELDAGSLEVYPLTKNGQIYGAVQTGTHRFIAVESDGTERLTSIANFTHVWLLENGEWKFSRGLSYNHHVPETR